MSLASATPTRIIHRMKVVGSRTFEFKYPIGQVRVICRVRNEEILLKLHLAQGEVQGTVLEEFPGYEITNIHRAHNGR